MGIKSSFIGDGHWEIGDLITIGMVQTLASREEEAKALSNAFGLVLLDEGHHAPASTFFDVLGLLSSKYRYSVSATPNRRDGLEKMIYLCVGPILANIDKDEVEGMGSTVPVTVFSIKTGFKPGLLNSWSEYLDTLTTNTNRNMLIIDLVQQSEEPTLVLVDRVAHAEQLSDMLNRRAVEHVVAHGRIGKKDREIVMDKIKSAKVTVGTTSLLGEGLDVSCWAKLIMGAPISSEIKLMQAIGRIVRPDHGKERAFVYDLKDDCGFSGASFNKRMEIYKKNKIWVEFRK
jgi:superfamily II DNA or RNA helicase